MDRRTLIRNSAGIAALAAGIGAAPAIATADDGSTSTTTDPYDFIPEDATTEEAADVLFADSSTERTAYVEHANRTYGDLPAREQLRAVLEAGEGIPSVASSTGTATARSGMAPAALPIIPIAAIAARALLAAAKRYGPAALRALKSAVSKGYSAFNDYVKEHAWAAAALGGVVGAGIDDVWEALKGLI